MADDRTMKQALTEVLRREMQQNEDIVLVGADLMGADGTWPLHEEFPGRVINVGIAEANMAGIAAGLAAGGKIPVTDTFAAFASRRNYDQTFVSIAYSGLDVKMIGSDPGVSAQANGGTHMAFEDVALMRTIPGMTVFEPCDTVQLEQSVSLMLRTEGSFYLRLFRGQPRSVYGEDYRFAFGRADILAEGCDAAVIASGAIPVENALLAAGLLAEEGIRVRVINMCTVKPIDAEAVRSAARDTGTIVTVENANYINGLGSAVAEVIAEERLYVPFERVGVKDEFGEVGTIDYLCRRFHIAPQDIAEAVRRQIAHKAG